MSNKNNAFNDEVKRRSDELQRSKDFDPRVEQELNEIYEQYIPPHSNQETAHLVDVAERDAYIDPFPPIGSQKMAGAAIKKGVRIAIGWYIQYIAQQISTFGSGVAQALRSLQKDVDELKDSRGSSDLYHLLESLELGTLTPKIFEKVSDTLAKSKKRLLISDAVTPEMLQSLETAIIIDTRQDVLAELPATADSRRSHFLPFIAGIEDNSVGGIVLHGTIDFYTPAQRADCISQASRVLENDSPLVILVRTSDPIDDLQARIAGEITATKIWSEETWQHVLSQSFSDCQQITLDEKGYALFLAKNG